MRVFLFLLVVVACSLPTLTFAQSTVPSFPPAPRPVNEPTDPAKPANHGFYQSSSSAKSKLSKYTNIIEVWFAGNSYDYIMGAYNPSSGQTNRGIEEYLAGLAAGTYQQQKYPPNAATAGESRNPTTPYRCLPFDLQSCPSSLQPPCAGNTSLLAGLAAQSGSSCLPVLPTEMSSLIPINNGIWQYDPSQSPARGSQADSAHWKVDPNHVFWNEAYGINGGANDGFLFWTDSGVAPTIPNWPYPLYSSRGGGTGYSYYNLSNAVNQLYDGGTVPYIYQLAANYTLFDNFYKSFMGASDTSFLGAAAGRLPKWANSDTACKDTTDVNYGPNGYYRAVPCVYGSDGFVTAAGLGGSSSLPQCNVFSDCTFFGELDGLLPSGVFPQVRTSTTAGDPTTCASVTTTPGQLSDPSINKTTGVYGFAPPVTINSIGDELDAKGVSWSFYGQGLNSQLNHNYCDAEYLNYSAHNNPFHYFQKFSDPTSTYFKTHLQDATAFWPQLAADTLPSFSWLGFNEVYDGAVSDSNIGMLEGSLTYTMNAIFNSPGWKRGTTLVAVAFSDHGGLWDHAAPYAGDKLGPGARVPLILVSPDHQGGVVNHYPYEHLSLRKMVQSRFGLTNTIMTPTRYLASRDLTNSFDESNACYNNNACSTVGSGANQCIAGNSYTPVSGAATCSSSNAVASSAVSLAALVLTVMLAAVSASITYTL